MLPLLAALSLAACSKPAPNPNGYAGTIFGFVDGKLALAQLVGVASTLDKCKQGVHLVIEGVKAEAPPGGSVAGTCYPVPDAPPPIRKIEPTDDQKTARN